MMPKRNAANGFSAKYHKLTRKDDGFVDLQVNIHLLVIICNRCMDVH